MRVKSIFPLYFVASFAVFVCCTSFVIFGINYLLTEQSNFNNRDPFLWIFLVFFEGFLFLGLLVLFYLALYKPLSNLSNALRGCDKASDSMNKVGCNPLREVYIKMTHSLLNIYDKIVISARHMDNFYNSDKEADFIISNLQEILQPHYLTRKFLHRKSELSLFFSIESRLFLGFMLCSMIPIVITGTLFLITQRYDLLPEYQSRILIFTYFLTFVVSFYIFGEYRKNLLTHIKKARFFCGEILSGANLKNQVILSKNFEEITLLQDIKNISDKIEKSNYEIYIKERKRQMQERLIRNEMTELINTLDEEFRNSIMTSFSDSENKTKNKEMLGFNIIINAFQKVSRKLQRQHSEMQTLIKDLRTALKDRAAYIALQKELEIAKKVQMSILPKPFGKNPYVAISGKSISAKEIGGDFYDYFYIGDSKVGIAIGDVSGKGIPAALFMASTRALLRSIAQESISPSRCLSQLNKRLSETNDESMFVTLLYGTLDLETGVFFYANAGHHHPYVINDGKITQLTSGEQDLALGVLVDSSYTDYKIVLKESVRVFIFTDGVTEAMNESGEEFSDARLKNALEDLGNALLDKLIDGIIERIREFSKIEQNDDITYLSFEFTKKRIA